MVQSEKAKKMRELKKFGKKVSEGCAPFGSRVHTQHCCTTAGSRLLVLLFTMCVHACVCACVRLCVCVSVHLCMHIQVYKVYMSVGIHMWVLIALELFGMYIHMHVLIHTVHAILCCA